MRLAESSLVYRQSPSSYPEAYEGSSRPLMKVLGFNMIHMWWCIDVRRTLIRLCVEQPGDCSHLQSSLGQFRDILLCSHIQGSPYEIHTALCHADSYGGSGERCRRARYYELADVMSEAEG